MLIRRIVLCFILIPQNNQVLHLHPVEPTNVKISNKYQNAHKCHITSTEKCHNSHKCVARNEFWHLWAIYYLWLIRFWHLWLRFYDICWYYEINGWRVMTFVLPSFLNLGNCSHPVYSVVIKSYDFSVFNSIKSSRIELRPFYHSFQAYLFISLQFFWSLWLTKAWWNSATLLKITHIWLMLVFYSFPNLRKFSHPLW